MREYSVPMPIRIPDDANLTDAVFTNATEVPDEVLFSRRVDGAWQPVSAKEFAHEVSGLAAGLIAAGIGPGDRVGLMSKTRYEWTLADYAIWTAGAVTVPIYETSSAEQVEWILGDSGAVAVVVETGEHAATVAAVRDRLPELREVWQIEVGDLDTLADRGRDVPAGEVERRRRAVRGDDLATIIYTSGTTGRPKGCVLTHRNFLARVRPTKHDLGDFFNADGSTLLFLPLAHIFARIIQVGVVEHRVHLAHTSDIKNLLDHLADFKPTFVLSVPRVFEKVFATAQQKAHASGAGAIFDRAADVAVRYSEALDAGGPGLWLRGQRAVFDRLVYRKLRAALGGAVTHAVSGGAPLGARLGHFFRGAGITILNGYGLTETTAAPTVNLPHANKMGTVGRPISGCAIRIADDGEILIKSESVFGGYWHDDASTAAALESDGWFHTGDIGELDDDGFLTITGRKKELIVTAGGKNVAPAVLEDRVTNHPLVSQCMVVGDQRPYVAALVTIDPEAFPAWKREHGKPESATVADLRDDPDLVTEIQGAVDDANKAVSRAEGIRRFRILGDDFSEASGELTPTLKLKRSVVMKQHADEVEALYG